MRERFDDFAAQCLRDVAGLGTTPPADLARDRARAEPDERDLPARRFGREPRVRPETAVQTLTEIWDAVIRR